jgi:hypothetical protein
MLKPEWILSTAVQSFIGTLHAALASLSWASSTSHHPRRVCHTSKHEASTSTKAACVHTFAHSRRAQRSGPSHLLPMGCIPTRWLDVPCRDWTQHRVFGPGRVLGSCPSSRRRQRAVVIYRRARVYSAERPPCWRTPFLCTRASNVTAPDEWADSQVWIDRRGRCVHVCCVYCAYIDITSQPPSIS